MSRRSPARRARAVAPWIFAALLLPAALGPAIRAVAQELPPALLDEAARRSGLSQEELLRLAREHGAPDATTVPAEAATPPGTTALPPAAPVVVLPGAAAAPPTPAEKVREAAVAQALGAREGFFGADFFRLDPGVFNPGSFGPVPEDYLLGAGDQVIVDVWGEVELRIERLVDRDGTIILPKGGRITCWNRTLAQVSEAVREALGRSYSGIETGTTFVRVSLGGLRAIRVFVVGDAVQPGAYDLNGVSTIFTALYAAGGPAAAGSWRDVRLLRGRDLVASLDLYGYLLEGKRDGDAILREGDTVFIPPRGATVNLRGAVRRPLTFELKAGEGLPDLLRFGGGLLGTAAVDRVSLERIVPPAERRPQQPDRITTDIPLDPATGRPAPGVDATLRDGDTVSVAAIPDRLENWVEIDGNVKHPGRYEWRDGLDVTALVADAGGPWADTLAERALIERLAADGSARQVSLPLGEVLAGRAPAVPLQPRDRLRIFSVWDVRDRYQVSITGEVRAPGDFAYRAGMTLSDLLLQAGGLKDSADPLKAEVSRLRPDQLGGRDPAAAPANVVDVFEVTIGPDYLAAGEPFPLQPRDRVAVRRLPWWELQRVVTIRGEVLYPGAYSLLRPDERLSELVARAGGLKETSFLPAARLERASDGVGNVAIDLEKALTKPRSVHDLTLRPGDELLIPEVQETVKVTGVVGFPTSLVFRHGQSLGDYIDSAGGYADGADKWKTRVVYPNGMSRPIKRIWRDPGVLAGSTIVVPAKAKQEDHTIGTLKDIAAILASVATVWLVIDRTSN
ncbi:MAG: polysaccharide biosynthesis/export family protein [Candidatus Krumholzibacteriia bacterium]